MHWAVLNLFRFQAPLKGKAVGLDYSLKPEPKYDEAREKK
jgi:hypothetical protein